ncbi:hypothetical protein [Desulfocucumis palustris]|uniref:hypothetical protein n=1 Tax=Desulfocucumis palustris TaxID=1898651 RepID=UPI000CE9B541|nr:hypothetical protein [Desulfocucumis palustris]
MLKLLLFFVQGIPESAGLVACSLALARVNLRWGVIWAVASVMTVVIYMVRSLPVTFGLHTVAAIFLSALFIARATRVPPSISFIVSFASFALLALLEVPMYELISSLLNKEVSNLMSDNYVWLLVGLPQVAIMIAIALLISKFRKPMEGMWRI